MAQQLQMQQYYEKQKELQQQHFQQQMQIQQRKKQIQQQQKVPPQKADASAVQRQKLQAHYDQQKLKMQQYALKQQQEKERQQLRKQYPSLKVSDFSQNAAAPKSPRPTSPRNQNQTAPKSPKFSHSASVSSNFMPFPPMKGESPQDSDKPKQPTSAIERLQKSMQTMQTAQQNMQNSQQKPTQNSKASNEEDVQDIIQRIKSSEAERAKMAALSKNLVKSGGNERKQTLTPLIDHANRPVSRPQTPPSPSDSLHDIAETVEFVANGGGTVWQPPEICQSSMKLASDKTMDEVISAVAGGKGSVSIAVLYIALILPKVKGLVSLMSYPVLLSEYSKQTYQ